MPLEIRPVTPDVLPALEDLFDDGGTTRRCWCMYWRIGNDYRTRSPDRNREGLKEVVTTGPPPGLLAFDNGVSVGWCQLTPRGAPPWLERSWRLARVDDLPVWSISCFYIRKGHRRQGITAALVGAAIDAARDAGAVTAEAYPLDGDLTSSASGTGYVTTFRRAGFTEVARNVPPRPVMRYDLR